MLIDGLTALPDFARAFRGLGVPLLRVLFALGRARLALWSMATVQRVGALAAAIAALLCLEKYRANGYLSIGIEGPPHVARIAFVVGIAGLAPVVP